MNWASGALTHASTFKLGEIVQRKLECYDGEAWWAHQIYLKNPNEFYHSVAKNVASPLDSWSEIVITFICEVG